MSFSFLKKKKKIGRLLPKLKLLPKRSDEAPIRVVPEDQSAKIIFLNEGYKLLIILLFVFKKEKKIVH